MTIINGWKAFKMKYKSNMQQVLNKLTGQLSVRDADALCREITLALYASQINRIHNDGLNKSLQPIGKYSTKPGYYDVNPFRANSVNMGKAPEGKKRGKSTFSSGEKHNMRYFPDGYEGFKAYLHYPRKVNLTLTKKLKEDTKWQKRGQGDYVIGFDTAYGSGLMDKLTEHFGGHPIWGVTSTDEELVKKIATEFVKKVTRA